MILADTILERLRQALALHKQFNERCGFDPAYQGTYSDIVENYREVVQALLISLEPPPAPPARCQMFHHNDFLSLVGAISWMDSLTAEKNPDGSPLHIIKHFQIVVRPDYDSAYMGVVLCDHCDMEEV